MVTLGHNLNSELNEYSRTSGASIWRAYALFEQRCLVHPHLEMLRCCLRGRHCFTVGNYTSKCAAAVLILRNSRSAWIDVRVSPLIYLAFCVRLVLSFELLQTRFLPFVSLIARICALLSKIGGLKKFRTNQGAFQKARSASGSFLQKITLVKGCGDAWVYC